MPFLELFDETLDINSTENYELCLQAGSDSLSFCVLDTIRNKFLLIRSFEPENSKYLNAERVKEILNRDDFLLKKYKKVNLIMPSQKFTIVPATLYDPARKDEYFEFNHVLNEGSLILSNKLSDPDSFLLFPVPAPLSGVMDSFFPGVLPFHQVKPLLNHISHTRKSINGLYLHLHVDREFFILIVFDQNMMKFCNSYKYRNINDIMYFTLNVFRTLGISQEETVHLSGFTEKYDDLSSNLSLYIRSLKYAEPSGNFTFSYVFDDMTLHRYLNLFTVVNCE